MSIRINMIRARSGDAFIVSVLSTPRPWLGVIDGGPPGIGTRPLVPLINKVINETPGHAAAVDLMAVTHVDEDHIGGILDLVRAYRAGNVRFEIRAAWHNSFQDLTGDEATVSDAALRDRMSRFIEADGRIIDPEAASVVVASISQGADLRDLLAELNLSGNPPVGGLLMRGHKPVVEGWPEIHILGPSPEQVDALRRYWDREVNQQRNAFTAAAHAAAAIDQSITNRSSLVFLLSHGGKSALFTGDARSDEVVASLHHQGLLDRRGEMHVDALKVPHHGSARSCGVELFKTVIADHYLISGNGRHGNPSLQTAYNLTTGLNGRAATVWMTYDIPEVTAHLARFPRVSVYVANDGDYWVIDL